ncbi:ParA family protein [Pseudoalteromonas peptidolytica]|uniref:AAA domain-containing protein n=1 Tax=Pseudoalteromonas peptidolytica F12-50-A1 TaxID=1315280 RepID=A0A8I0MZM6_9GAMM|nr:ParA family protein [Pseudoalteromonas peptidolytica]MBE0348252.1 hypothetical protein [Pseudoalteromonas peptidolytica F12-50-A1]NLR16540.1 ParA family protein [Pseudoalteromonas peptidolytica]GEK08906.1 chromosome partitioning protein ParA [Pseudoalteromonas peptidolytica]
MIITIAHHKGGVGKTTVALNVAEELKPDFIIDLDAHDSISIINQMRDDKLDVRTVGSTAKPKDELIKLIKESDNGKLILIDCGGFDSGLTRIAIAASDLLITPASDHVTEMIGLTRFQKTLDELSEKTGDKIIAHVLLYKMHSKRTDFSAMLEFINKRENLTALNSPVSHLAAFDQAMNNGSLGVTKHKSTKYGKAARQIKALTEEIKSLLEHQKLHG